MYMTHARLLESGTHYGERFILTVLLLCVAGPLFSQTIQEDNLKAHYLVNFIDFVEWGGSRDRDEPITIGVIDAPSVAKSLEELAAQRHASKRGVPFRVVGLSIDGDFSVVDVLYVDRGQQILWDILSRKANEHRILLVGEGSGFMERTGVIEFVTVRNNLRFSVNLTRAKDLNIFLSSKLLKLAVDVL